MQYSAQFEADTILQHFVYLRFVNY